MNLAPPLVPPGALQAPQPQFGPSKTPGPGRPPPGRHAAQSGSATIPAPKQFGGNVQRSPSRVRQANQTGTARVDSHLYSPFALRKQDGSFIQPGFSPQVGLGPALVMPGKNASMTSSSVSFYFTPHHMPGAPPAGAPGPVPASHFAADTSDPIDLMMCSALGALDRDAASKLVLRRIAVGKYEIDGRQISIRWGEVDGMPGLLACEDDVKDSAAAEIPLISYLNQAANVAASLCGQRADMPRIARIPKEQRLTFADNNSTDSTAALKLDSLGNERCESMRIACEQALLREQAAEAYELRMVNPFARSKTRAI